MKNQPLVIGIAAAVITIAIGVGLVLAVTSGDDRAGGTAAPGANPSSSSSSSTTTRSSTTTTSPSPSTVAPTTAVGAPTTPETEPPEPPEPPHPLDRYDPIPLPPGISATISSCRWTPASGGLLEATGTITNVAADDDFWGVNVYWLVWNQTQNEDIEDQYEIYDLVPGQTLQWNLSTNYPSAPPNLSCAVEVD